MLEFSGFRVRTLCSDAFGRTAVPSPAPALLEPVKVEGSDDEKETELLPAEP